ncbi:hypothetical protein HY087_00710, partial [Candidatus Gottesmanbacteria bacterium]|nr:hypothetical protein [Candidatus Gottesmanbacteria bacterium]
MTHETMSDQMPEGQTDNFNKAIPAIGIAFFILTGIVIVGYLYSRPRGGTVVLPGGITYLGPSPTKATSDKRQAISEKIPIPSDAGWATQTGKKYPYSFLYPTSLSLGFFPNDPFDA